MDLAGADTNVVLDHIVCKRLAVDEYNLLRGILRRLNGSLGEGACGDENAPGCLLLVEGDIELLYLLHLPGTHVFVLLLEQEGIEEIQELRYSHLFRFQFQSAKLRIIFQIIA